MIRGIKIWAPLAALAALVSCAPLEDSGQVSRQSTVSLSLPQMKSPAGNPAPDSNRSNASIAQDFMLLAFQLESGRPLPVLSRFEGPVSVRVTGSSIRAVSQRDLDQLIQRLRKEARISISQVPSDVDANLTLHFLPRETLRRTVPHAACFVAPGVDSWTSFLANRRGPGLDWTKLTTRQKMAIFLPGDVSAQEIRDCMHEEIAQALGPVNDLYHLTDSVFNDDNFHTVLTGFDMLVLRAFYDDDLHSGMTADQVQSRLMPILNGIHPRGRGGGQSDRHITPKNWSNEIEMAMAAQSGSGSQLAAASRAVAIAREHGWQDNRLGFSLYAQGRLALGENSRLALESFAQADAIFRANPDTRLHAAHVAVQSAAYSVSAGRTEETIKIVDANSPVALRAENASLLATLLMIKATALDVQGKAAEADIVRQDAVGWARYGLVSNEKIRQRLREISQLAPRTTGNENL